MKISVLLNLIVLSAFGQPNTMLLEQGAESPAATLEVASWITGAWEGEGLGGYCEEIWSPAKGGSMFGTFRVIKNHQLQFSEYMELTESDGSILLRLKHFGKDFTGWEEKDKYVEFKLVKISEGTLYFDGLTYRKTNENEMEVIVLIGSGTDSKEEKFTYRKMKN
ncbi:MAG: hypothetical protein DHS20C17_23220 [Cyclobacteriaceae bacterium]|nr:MAG: hypothetical protein DHS20C17_23220 [Cyclobacteriaceae bacterium]